MDFLREAIELASPVREPSLGAGAGECNKTGCGSAAFAETIPGFEDDSSFAATWS